MLQSKSLTAYAAPLAGALGRVTLEKSFETHHDGHVQYKNYHYIFLFCAMIQHENLNNRRLLVFWDSIQNRE